jgi:hypothetical protein
MLASLDGRLSTECTFTEDISGYGARVLAKQRWRINDSVLIKSLEGNFESEARVVYSNLVRNNSCAVGLALLRPFGQWTAPVNGAIRRRA